MYNNISFRYVNFGLPNPQLPSFVITGAIPQYNNQYSDYLVTTAASDNHGYGSFNLLYSVLLFDPYASIVYVDLGLSSELLHILNAHFHTLHQIQTKMKSNGFIAYRKFNWNSFPKWMNMTYNRFQRGGYAWKAIPMVDAFFEWKGIFSWLDGGSVIVDGITRELSLARRYGFYSPPSSPNILRWAHKSTREFMLKNGLIKQTEDNDPLCMAGILYIDYSKSFTHEIMEKYRECSYTKKCIGPSGSTMSNHRMDQAVLSLILNDYRIPKSMNYSYSFHPSLRNENGNTFQILSNLLFSIQHVYSIELDNNIYNISTMKYNYTKLNNIKRTMNMVMNK